MKYIYFTIISNQFNSLVILGKVHFLIFIFTLSFGSFILFELIIWNDF